MTTKKRLERKYGVRIMKRPGIQGHGWYCLAFQGMEYKPPLFLGATIPEAVPKLRDIKYGEDNED